MARYIWFSEFLFKITRWKSKEVRLVGDEIYDLLPNIKNKKRKKVNGVEVFLWKLPLNFTIYLFNFDPLGSMYINCQNLNTKCFNDPIVNLLNKENCQNIKGIQNKNSAAYFWMTNFSLLFADEDSGVSLKNSCKK